MTVASGSEERARIDVAERASLLDANRNLNSEVMRLKAAVERFTAEHTKRAGGSPECGCELCTEARAVIAAIRTKYTFKRDPPAPVDAPGRKRLW